VQPLLLEKSLPDALAELPMVRQRCARDAGITEVSMANELAALSSELAAAVAHSAPRVVAVHARPRFSSSGAFWRPGIVVTAEHAIRQEEEIRVTLPDGSDTKATVAGSDPGTDLAVLRVEATGPAGELAKAEVAPGNLALAIGRSEDSGINATWGIISAVSGPWRTWRGGRLNNYIRLDLTLYPQSTGALVVDTAGAAVGIATPALSRIAGLAIPAATIDRVVEEILSRGHVARAYLGVGLQPVELPDHQKGLIVLSLAPDGPAAKSGVLIGDVLVALAGTPVTDTDEVQSALEPHGAGKSVEAELVRGGEKARIAITIGERPRRS
jgi:S1-C subfamily serine protease